MSIILGSPVPAVQQDKSTCSRQVIKVHPHHQLGGSQRTAALIKAEHNLLKDAALNPPVSALQQP
jgi:hypothetical protein